MTKISQKVLINIITPPQSYRNMYAVEPDTEGLIGAVAITCFVVIWFVFLLEIGNKMTLIYKLYEIAGVITFQNPWILICGFVVKRV